VFESEGTILDVRVNPKNFAFVVFDGPDPVQKIMATREQFHLHGRRLNIELKRPSAMRYSGPRSGGGGGGDRGGDRGDRDRGDRSRPSGGLGGGAGGGGGGGGFGGKPRNKGGKR
jgi:RNA recognition motif-containing protein